MGITTFSGPIKAGTIKETTGTTLGVNIKNTLTVTSSAATNAGSVRITIMYAQAFNSAILP